MSLGQQPPSHTHTLEGSSYHSSLNCDKFSGEHIPSLSQSNSSQIDQFPINQNKNVGKPINNLEGSFFALGGDIIPNKEIESVKKSRTPFIDQKGKTKLILSQESINKQASELHDSLSSNLTTFSTQGP